MASFHHEYLEDKNNKPLAWKLLAYILLFSAVFTFFATAFQLYLDYKRDVGQIDKQIKLIENSYIKPLAAHVWGVDKFQAEIVLTSILNLPDIQYVELVDSTTEITLYLGEKTNLKSTTYQFALEHVISKTETVYLGKLSLNTTLSNVYSRLRERVLTILITQTIKTFLVSLFIFFITFYLITRHLTTISKYASAINLSTLDHSLALNRKPSSASKHDELDKVVSSLNDMHVRILSEIAAGKKTEQALRNSEEKFRGIFNQAAVGVARVGLDGSWIEVNTKLCDIVEYPQDELLTKTFQDITHPNDLKTALNYVNQLIKDEIKTYSMEKRYFKKHGDIVWINLTVSLMRDINNDPDYFIAVIEDISDRKLAEEKISKINRELELRVADRTLLLQASNKELEAFAYSVSHDLRAPLRAIGGYSQMLIEDYADKLDDNGKRQLGVVCDSAEEMGELIDGLLAFSRLGRAEMQRSTIDMETLIKEVFAKLQQSQESTSAKLILNPLPDVSGDRILLQTVFTNLLSNAVKFAKPGQPAIIEVTGRVQGNETLYSVKDKGVGFDMHYVDKIFQVFQRLHSAKDFAGTGIGLALVQRIIHRSGGRVWAEGEVDKGATVTFTLPRQQKTENDFQH